MRSKDWIYDFLFILALLAGAFFRTVGLDWDQGQHLHPDERFLTMVESALDVKECADPGLALPACPPAQRRWISPLTYFSTARSPLNPANRGYTFYVYGDLPIIWVNVTAELVQDASQALKTWQAAHPQSAPWLSALDSSRDWTGYGGVHLIGRQMSALADLLTILLLYLMAARVYNRRVALLAAVFSSLAVLQIQQSHFFTVDTFANLFIYLALYFALRVWEAARDWQPDAVQTWADFWRAPVFWPTLLFGLTLGMALASKINAAPLALMLPAAFALALYPAVSVHPARKQIGQIVLLYLVAGGLATILSFRIFQPYAFSGLLTPDMQWLNNLRELHAQASGDADVPFALQWARRSHLFSLKNMVLWGLGLPLGLLAWSGFLLMGWRMLKGAWQKHALLWGWTAVYFIWQSLQFNPTMRYQLPIYPLLALMAAWFVTEAGAKLASPRGRKIVRAAARIGGALVLLATAAWAYAFTRIYTREHTRVQATRWIYAHLPGAITLEYQKADGNSGQMPLPFPNNAALTPENPFETSLSVREDGWLTEILLPHVRIWAAEPLQVQVLLAQVSSDGMEMPLWAGALSAPLDAPQNISLSLGDGIHLMAGSAYRLRLTGVSGDASADFCAPIHFSVLTDDLQQQVLPFYLTDCHLTPAESLWLDFVAPVNGVVQEMGFEAVQSVMPDAGEQRLSVQVTTADGQTAEAQLRADFGAAAHPLGDAWRLPLSAPLPLKAGESLRLHLDVDQGALSLTGAAPANESTWDDGLPLRLDGLDGFGGLYANGLNFEMYWDDNADKLARFEKILDEADYIFISSNRQWATIPRVPERYPLSTAYYRALIGCPPAEDLIGCYNVARPGQFEGQLGFELVQVFESFPTLTLPNGAAWQINDQFAEEAFTVYDHPKVLIFRKADDYDSARVDEILGAVDLTHVVHLTPRQAGRYKPLLLSPQRMDEQRQAGTWSALFSYQSWQNRYPILGWLLWYVFIALLGWLSYPIVRAALPALPDHGYPLARMTGLLLLAWFAWLAASLGLTYSRAVIGASLALLAALGLFFGWRQREALREEWRTRKTWFLQMELLFFLLFAADLLIRWGNPDLWHPSKGGERPMDFSYFNAILKTLRFPPYDPWFAGGYINYYYYGWVIVATPVKLLGIVPSIAYNLILPTLFAMLGMGAFSLGWNLLADWQPPRAAARLRAFLPWIGGGATLSGLLLLGNLGEVQTLWRALQRLGAPDGIIDVGHVFQRIYWALLGFWHLAQNAALPLIPGDFYWLPSRVIPAPGSIEPITEFPLFTFLYSDLHAHMIDLPITVLIIAWVFALLRARGRWASRLDAAAGMMLGALFIGATRAVNTWDYPTYVLFALIGAAFAFWQSGAEIKALRPRGALKARLAYVLAALVGLYALIKLFYLPFDIWFGSAYSQISLWHGPYTPVTAYLTHWGLFLFVIVAWMTWETREWLDAIPLSALKKLAPWRIVIEGALYFLAVVFLALTVYGVRVVWLALPLALWAGILLLRPDLPPSKRLVFFMLLTAALLTFVVEVVVLQGDIGRMNTVFKFYLQAWTLFALSAGAAFAWTLAEYHRWLPKWRAVWETGLMVLLVGAFSFTMMGTLDKIRDRWVPDAPHSLDSMAYMPYAQYADFDVLMHLDEDYRAIRWMQEHVPGTPVIVEANTVEYHWGSRFTIYTGLPGVVGWNWHQRQQRALADAVQVERRVAEVHQFYNTADVWEALAFLRKYHVRYIIVGQLERAEYLPEGIAKFKRMDGWFWHTVYQDGDTVIYEVR